MTRRGEEDTGFLCLGERGHEGGKANDGQQHELFFIRHET